MKIKKIGTKLNSEILEDFEVDEIIISDSDIHRYLDMKYDSEEIVILAQQLNKNIQDGDLDAAYAEIIRNFNSIDESSSKDLKELKEYIEDLITNE